MPVTNASDNEKTIKRMYTVMNSDNYTIDRTLVYSNYNDTAIAPFENILSQYQDYFDKELIEVDVPKRFYYQPAAFAENYYGTPGLDFIVLYFAKMTSLFEFKRPKIRVLPSSKLPELNRLFTEYRSMVNQSLKAPIQYIKQSEI